MRISANEQDLGYCAEAFTAKVYLDGIELIGRCITADEEKGEALCYKQPPIEGKKETFETEILKGAVKVVIE